ncbi:unnamed protein product [Angiostrongylus costaricensis]|uniref:Glutaredoxin domain-containing protein n=1 Tax=Angiostrongylus costaricensis TaxID=334426 RepID=A0A0R3PJ92_ANGCS|nr:unnamed protein product [Angiostrongylus costaricensis]
MGGGLDLAAILLDLQRMRLELESVASESILELVQAARYPTQGFFRNGLRWSLESSQEMFVIRKGSIRGRNLHVFNTIRMMRIRSQWQVELLRALKIKAEFRDLHINSSLVDELTDRMQLRKSDRKLVYDGLPMVYVNGKYFGNDSTLIQENDNNNLVNILRDFQGRLECATCQGIGYTVCRFCRGGKKIQETFRVRLRCTRCDRNGIAHCPSCSSS